MHLYSFIYLDKRQATHHFLDGVATESLRDHRVSKFVPEEIHNIDQRDTNTLPARVQTHDLVQLLREDSAGHNWREVDFPVLVIRRIQLGKKV